MNGARIVLVRHGPSAHTTGWGWLDRSAVERWRDAYDREGIAPHSRPPVHLERLAATATLFVSSDLSRAMMSAERIAGGKPVTRSPMFREVALPIPRWPGRLPFAAWGALIHVAWGYRLLSGRDERNEHEARVHEAVRWLIEHAERDANVLVVTHGVMRRHMARRLLTQGWQAAGRFKGYQPWSAWVFASAGG